MNTINKKSMMLEHIQDPNLPLEISYFPETIGWKILFFILVILVTKILFNIYKKWKSNKYRREALFELKKTENMTLSNASKRLSKILKVTANYALPKEKIYSISNEDLFQILNNNSSSAIFKKELFLKWQIEILKDKKDSEYENEEINKIREDIQEWIINHRRETI